MIQFNFLTGSTYLLLSTFSPSITMNFVFYLLMFILNSLSRYFNIPTCHLKNILLPITDIPSPTLSLTFCCKYKCFLNFLSFQSTPISRTVLQFGIFTGMVEVAVGCIVQPMLASNRLSNMEKLISFKQ